MSVILYDQIKVNKLVGMMNYHHNEMMRLTKSMPHFSHHRRWLLVFNSELTQEQIVQEFIGRMLWYAMVANKVAYALQYREDVSFKGLEVDYGRAKPVPCSKKELFRELNHLIYNMHTNDGNMFMEEKWYESLADICRGLAFE